MLTRLIAFALNNRLTVLGLFLAISVIGIRSAAFLPIDAVPDITSVQVQVNVKTGPLDPEKIEMLVTRPLEIEFSGLPRMTEMRSISKFGLSQTTLVFEDGTDVYWARQQVAERAQTAAREMPAGVSPELAPVTTGLGEVYMFVLEAIPGLSLAALPEEKRLTQLRTIQDFVVRPFIKRVNGVADVDSNGGFVKQIHVNLLPEKLEAQGLSIIQIEHALMSLGDNSGGGYVQTGGDQIIVRTLPTVETLEALSDYPIAVTPLGRVITVKDVASVREDHALRVGAATYDGQETVLGTVLMRVGANGRDVVNGVEEAIQELKLPEGVRIKTLYTRKFLVNATISTVSKSLAEGAALVVLILLVLLGHPIAAFIVACAIPISMLFAAEGMRFFGVTGNLMSLGAIDFGLLVDGSVVLIESILTRLALQGSSPNPTEKRRLVLESSSEVVKPVVTGLLLIMVVYLPVLMLEGVEGKMFRPMALTVLMALAGSLFIAVFLMPVLADIFLKMPAAGHAHETVFFRFAKRLYIPLLDRSLLHPRSLMVSTVALMLLAGLALTRLGSDFIPQLDEGDMVLGLTRDARVGVDRSVAEQKETELLLRSYPEIKDVFARLGTPESATDPMGVNLADTFLLLEKDRSRWRFPSKDALFQDIRQKLEVRWPTTEVSATQPIEMRFNEMLEGSRADVNLRLYGSDLMTLYHSALEAAAIIQKVPGVETIEQDPLTALRKGPVLDIRPDFASLSRYGILLEQFNLTVATAMAGTTVGSYFQDGYRFPLVVHLDEAVREDPLKVAALPMDLPRGGTVPLSRVAHLEKTERITTIARRFGLRYAALSINIAGRDIGSFVADAQVAVQEQLKLPPGYSLSWGGQFKNLERANARLLLIVPLTLLGVFLLLLKGFGDFKKTLLVFSSVPFAAVGGVFALWARGLDMSVSAGVGFIALIGIAILNALVLITILSQEMHKDGDPIEAVKRATLSRLRPVLMTALVAGLGFIPMALNTGIGSEVQRPLATVVIGGLLSATFLTLMGLPAFFLWMEKRRST